MMCQMEDMRLELEPAWAQPEEETCQHDKEIAELNRQVISLTREVRESRSYKKMKSGVKPF